MMTQHDHCTPEELQNMVEDTLSAEERKRVDSHLRTCRECRNAAELTRRIDTSLRGLPLTVTSAGFTASVVAAVRPDGRATRFMTFLVYLPYLLGMAVVLGTMLVAFAASGAMRGSSLVPLGDASRDLTQRFVGAVNDAGASVAQALGTYLPFVFSPGAFTTSLAVAGAVLILLAVDRLVGRKLR